MAFGDSVLSSVVEDSDSKAPHENRFRDRSGGRRSITLMERMETITWRSTRTDCIRLV